MASSEDPRKAFVVDLIAGAIAPPGQKDAFAQYLGKDATGAVAAFLDDASTHVLQASVAKSAAGQTQVKLSNNQDFPAVCSFQVTLTKNIPGPVALEALPGCISVSTISQSPVSSLYHSLKDVYSPLLGLSEQQGRLGATAAASSEQLNPRLQELLLQVQAGLGAAAKLPTPAGRQALPLGLPADVLTPLDELEFWLQLANDRSAGVLSQAARQVTQQLEALRPQLEGLAAGNLTGDWEGAKELVTAAADALRHVWPVKVPPAGWAYSTERMQHLLRTISAALALYVQARLQGVDLWRTSFPLLKGSLLGALELLGSWASEAAGLVQDWQLGVDGGGHRWEGGATLQDPYLDSFRTRLEQVYSMREVGDELAQLMQLENSGRLDPATLFAPFAGMPVLHVSPYTEPRWQMARQEYHQLLAAAEQQVVQKLREQCAAVLLPSLSAAVGVKAVPGQAPGHPQQVLVALKRYGRLLARPAVDTALQREKQSLIDMFDRYIEQLQQELEHHRASSQSGRRGGSAAPDVCTSLSWSKQCLQKAQQLQEVLGLLAPPDTSPKDQDAAAAAAAAAAVGDGAGGGGVRHCLVLCQELVKELKQFGADLFEGWQDALSAQLSDVARWRSSQLMTVDVSSRHVRMYFSDTLMKMLQEVRQVQALGFSCSSEVLREVKTASSFLRYALVLKQCANFYNNIATQMIPSQKPMMLADAIEFEQTLLNPKDSQGRDITWQSVSGLDGYVRRLHAVAERLADKNRSLRACHAALLRKVLELMSTDLVLHKDRWAAGVKDMRSVFSRLEAEGFPADSQALWRQHWDHQLYKALEVQYKQGLEVINKNLAEVDLAMVFKGGQLQYEPSLEDVRMRHYRDYLNPFLGLPLKMKGVSNLSQSAGFFRTIADSCPDAIAQVYAGAEALFTSLTEELKKYTDWVALGSAGDMDELLDSQLQEVADWEANLKMLKAAAREAERLPNMVRVGCYRVSLVVLKATIEEHMKRCRDALGLSLRRKAVQERQQLEDFLSSGNSLLSAKISSVEEIGRAGQEARSLVDQLPNMSQMCQRVEEKNRLLRQIAAAGSASSSVTAVDMSEVQERWDAFTTSLHQHDAHLEGQRGELQQQVLRQVEDFKGTIAGFASRWSGVKPQGGPAGNPAVILAQLQDVQRQLQELQGEAARYNQELEALGLEPAALPGLEEVAEDIRSTHSSWSRYGDFLAERDALAGKDWLSMRDQVHKIEDFLTKWEGVVSGKGTDGQQDASTAAIAVLLLNEVKIYRRCLPHLRSCLRGAGWEDTHWGSLFALLGFRPGSVTKETVTLAQLLDKADVILTVVDKIKALDAQAQGESVIRKALTELKLWGLQREFAFLEAAGGQQQGKQAGGPPKPDIPLVKEWQDLMTEVGDHQSLVASLKQSSYYNLFKDEISSWDSRLATLQDGLMLLNSIQRKWVYLQPLFARGALPAQQQRFKNVDTGFRALMVQLAGQRQVVYFAEVPGILERLGSMIAQLEACQKALAEYLEEKRALFPRFYFMGDDDLLEVLGQARNPAVMQSHLRKVFAGIHRVRFSADQAQVTAMCSVEGEAVELTSPVVVSDNVEVWLGTLTSAMRATLQQQLTAAQREADCFATAPGQVVCLKAAISFTSRVESAIQSGTLSQLAAALRGELARLSATDCSSQVVLQLKKQGLIIDLMHQCDVAEQLATSQPSKASDWEWSRQLRFYGSQGGAVTVHMAEGTFNYTWEYQGNAPKLVLTPLTDKCFLTLTQAMALGYGGNPYGPAGTGKTESVKALGQAMARQVLVFNCDEEFDFKAMGRIFVGLLKCGAWGCFDEFNRLGEDVLSAVSQQIQAIQGALKEGTRQLNFMGNPIEVDPNTGIFVTLNPAGKGYGGRSKLPDNLKQLFRPIAMSVPDSTQIAAVMLASEGFATAAQLAGKVTTLFTLAAEGLTRQQHYDWGLRALKTMLGTAGRLLRQAVAASGQSLTPEDEAKVVVQAICTNKLPTLTFQDNSRFRGLVGDVFPGVPVTDATDPELEAAIRQAAAARKLTLPPEQVEKMLQLHLTCHQRIGVILVGPAGSGKSTLWQLLEEAYALLSCKPVVYLINPKAMPRQQLLGSLNLDTREWTDGVLTAAARKVVQEPLEQRSWIICDGDVDPEWIESLNSVLDDNRLLTMPNGERIQFSNNVNFIFECHSLAFASPATVSRCGMLYLNEEAVTPTQVLQHWLLQHADADPTGQLQQWFDQLFPQAFDWVADRGWQVPTTRHGLLCCLLSQLAAGVTSKRGFAVSLVRGLGAGLPPTTRQEFAEAVSRWSGEGQLLEVAAGEDPLACLQLQADAADALLLGGQQGAASGPQLVLTPEVRSQLALLGPWLHSKEPFLLVGPEGCGKNSLLQHCFAALPPGMVVASVACSAQTTSTTIIQKLMQVCGKPVTTRAGKTLRPDTGRVILYLKDINLPKPDKYETIQLIACLQQLLTHGGYHDDNLEFIRVEGVQIVASLVPGTSLGRSSLTTRFTSRTHIAAVGYPSQDALSSIYTSQSGEVLSGWRPPGGMSGSAAGQQASALCRLVLEVYAYLLAHLTPDQQPHYTFTPRDLTHWVQGLARYDPGQITLSMAVAAEARRVFRDRIVGAAAAQAFDEALLKALKTHLGHHGGLPIPLCSSMGATGSKQQGANGSASCGQQLAEWAAGDFTELLRGLMTIYGRDVKEPEVILVPQVLERAVALDRALSKPGGALMLVGPAGSGRRALVQLVGHGLGLHTWTPAMTRKYDARSFRNDLKEVLRVAGVEGRPTLLLLEDHQLEDPGVLEAVNSLLAGGEVPGLFTPEELAKDLAPLDRAADEDMTYSGPRQLYPYFLHRLQQRLRLCVCLNPEGSQYKARCEANPALLTRCTMVVWNGWSEDSCSLLATSELQVPEIKGKDKAAAVDADPALVAHMVGLHKDAARVGAAPRHFAVLVRLYKALLKLKQEQLQEQRCHLQGGLDKLAEASDAVAELNAAAEPQRALLRQKQSEADEALSSIQASMETAAERRREVEGLTRELATSEVALTQQRGVVEEQLSEVQPLLDAARAAVGSIKADNINEIRSLRMAPDAIRDVLEGVMLLMGQEDTSWSNMKTFLGKKSVKDDLINYDAHRITPSVRSKVEKLLAAKGQSFEKEVIYRASQAAGPMATWVVANLSFSKVLLEVAPLEKQLDGLTRSLTDSQARLGACQQELAQLDEQVVRLKQDFQLRIREAEALKLDLAKAEATIAAATELLSKLSGERTRWGQQLAGLDAALAQLPRDVLLAAALITYLTPHPEDVRATVLGDWRMQLQLPEWSLTQLLSSTTELLGWKAQGLPADELSQCNAIAVLHAISTPLLIDPSSKAINWLLEHLRSSAPHPPEVVAMHEQRFVNSLELAVRFGKVLVVTEVDKVPPLLYPLLRKDLSWSGPRKVVAVGDKQVDWDEGFRLFLVTRNPRPSLPPDVSPLLTIANFSTTRGGLEGQLLGLTIAAEEPQLEAQRAGLMHQQEALALEVAGLEKQLLESLASSTGNILENTALLSSLNEASAKAATISTSLEQSRELSAQLEQRRSLYRPLAQLGSGVYFALQDLPALNPMYCFSLAAFLGLFKAVFAKGGGLGEGGGGEALTQRITYLQDRLVQGVYEAVARAMFNRDRLVLALHLLRTVQPDACSTSEWQLLLGRGGASSGSNSSNQGGAGVAAGGMGRVPPWVPLEAVEGYQALQQALPQLAASCCLDDSSIWEPWVTDSGRGGGRSGGVGGRQVPDAIAGRVSAFQELLLVKLLKPDRLMAAASTIVCRQLTLPGLSPPPLSLRHLLTTDLAPGQPLLLIVTPGADPSVEVADLAEATVGRSRLQQVAMGQGQAEAALKLLRECAASGDWLLLKNLHLVAAWLPALEKELHALAGQGSEGGGAGSGVAAGFRLVLTTEAHQHFPSTLLENCLKVTYEAPPGLRNNLQRTYSSWSQQFLEDGGRTGAAAGGTPLGLRPQLLFLLSWFHALVQERCQYVPQGWTKVYEFSAADLRSACDLIARCAAAGAGGGAGPGGVSWPYLQNLLLHAIYAGRVDDKYDAEVLSIHLHSILSPELLNPSSPAGAAQRALLGLTAALPSSASKPEWGALLGGLPEADAPAAFGLPANIDKVVALAAGGRLTAALRQLSTGQVAQAAFDRRQWGEQLLPLISSWQAAVAAAPAPVQAWVHAGATSAAASGSAAGSHTASEGPALLRNSSSLQRRARGGAGGSGAIASAPTNPVDDFVELEVAAAARLLGAISATLTAVQRLLSAAEAPAAAVQVQARCLLTNTLPPAWEAAWDAGPDTPLEFCRAALARATALEMTWRPRCAAPGGLLGGNGPPLHLGELFRPGALLQALRQAAARSSGLALDGLRLVTTCDPRRLPPQCPLQVAVTGLVIQGASFDGTRLTPLQQGAPVLSPLPPLVMAFLPPAAPLPHPTHLATPLYATQERLRVIAQLQLPVASPEEAQRWALAGVAVILAS